MHDDDDRDETEWTTDEHAALRALPVERAPDSDLLARTTAALRQRGLLKPEDRRSQPVPRVRRVLAFAVAASIVFVAGGAAGYRLAEARMAARATDASVRLANESVPSGALSDSTAHIVWF